MFERRKPGRRSLLKRLHTLSVETKTSLSQTRPKLKGRVARELFHASIKVTRFAAAFGSEALRTLASIGSALVGGL